MNISKPISIFCLTFVVMSSSFAIDSGIRGQIVRSKDFTDFKKSKVNLYRTQANQQSKNAHETCIANEHSKIKADPAPPFYPYFGIRMTEYKVIGRTYAINELEACIEHDYFNHNCKPYHDNSLICNGVVFTSNPIGEASANSLNINSDNSVKSAIDSAVEEAMQGSDLGQ